jgi:hypothetical protein
MEQLKPDNVETRKQISREYSNNSRKLLKTWDAAYSFGPSLNEELLIF